MSYYKESQLDQDIKAGYAAMLKEARVQAKVDFEEFGYWQDRYPNNRLLQEAYRNAFADAYAEAQCIDNQWSDPDA